MRCERCSVIVTNVDVLFLNGFCGRKNRVKPERHSRPEVRNRSRWDGRQFDTSWAWSYFGIIENKGNPLFPHWRNLHRWPSSDSNVSIPAGGGRRVGIVTGQPVGDLSVSFLRHAPFNSFAMALSLRKSTYKRGRSPRHERTRLPTPAYPPNNSQHPRRPNSDKLRATSADRQRGYAATEHTNEYCVTAGYRSIYNVVRRGSSSLSRLPGRLFILRAITLSRAGGRIWEEVRLTPARSRINLHW